MGWHASAAEDPKRMHKHEDSPERNVNRAVQMTSGSTQKEVVEMELGRKRVRIRVTAHGVAKQD